MSKAISNIFGREPDLYVGGKDNPYMLRWYITPWSGWFRDKDIETLPRWKRFVRTLPNIYLHKFLRDDDDRALHDHPWSSLSIILTGGYWEHIAGTGKLFRMPGDIVYRRATHAHRVELFKNPDKVIHVSINSDNTLSSGLEIGGPKPAWTLFITGFKVRDWGFHCPKGWRRWQDFVSKDDPGLPGRGCE